MVWGACLHALFASPITFIIKKCLCSKYNFHYQEVVGDLLYHMTELRPSSTIKLTWTACDVIGHVANCQVSVACSWGSYWLCCTCAAVCWCLQLGSSHRECTGQSGWHSGICNIYSQEEVSTSVFVGDVYVASKCQFCNKFL